MMLPANFSSLYFALVLSTQTILHIMAQSFFRFVFLSVTTISLFLYVCAFQATWYPNMHRLIHTNEPWHLFIKLPQPTLPCCVLSGTRNQHALFLVAFNSQMSSSALIRPETSACVLFLHTITTLSSQSAVLGSHT